MIENGMNQELFQLLKSALSSSKMNGQDLSDWNIISEELKKHAIFPLAADAVINSSISDSERLEIYKAVANNIKYFHRIMAAQTKVIALLKENDIPSAIMKGAAAAQYYPKPELRQMGDIDIIVLPEDYEKAFGLLCAFGYHNEQSLDDPDRRHIGFRTKDGLEIELHRYFSTSKNTEQNSILDNWLYDQLGCVRQVDVCGYTVPVFPSLENGLILLGHINQHLSSGLGLRQIIDWFFYVQSELNDDYWTNTFKAKAEAIGMRKLAVVVTRMCQKYLGLNGHLTWCKDAEEDLVDELMNYVLKKGNFGRKVEKGKYSTITVMHSFSNFRDTFFYLTKAGSCHMKEAGLKPIKAVAWLYQIGHLLRMTIKRQGDVNLSEEMKTAKEETAFLKRLEITRL